MGSKTLDTTWGGADSARKEETRNSGCILRLREWGCHVISHLGVPDQGAYGSRPQTHPPPTPGAPKDHPSSTNIARFRYPHGGIRKREILAGSLGLVYSDLWIPGKIVLTPSTELVQSKSNFQFPI